MNSRKFIDLTLYQHQFDYQPNFESKADILIYLIQNGLAIDSRNSLTKNFYFSKQLLHTGQASSIHLVWNT